MTTKTFKKYQPENKKRYYFWPDDVKDENGREYSFENTYSSYKCYDAEDAKYWAVALLIVNKSFKTVCYRREGGRKTYKLDRIEEN